MKANTFSVNSIAKMLVVWSMIFTFVAYLNGTVLSIGIIVKAYPTAKASLTDTTSLEVISHPSGGILLQLQFFHLCCIQLIT